MKKVFGIPTPTSATPNNGIHMVVHNMARHLPAYGWEVVEHAEHADLIAHHAGEGNGHTDVAICHGLHPTGVVGLQDKGVEWEINRRVIADLVAAKDIIVPSQWVAQILRRDLHVEPHVINWGINLEDWQHDYRHEGYVLWNKNRVNATCNPVWLDMVAQQTPAIKYITTFGKKQSNVRVTGQVPFSEMQELIKRAGVYLATTKETGDIGSREALAAGVPVVAFAQGGVLDIIQHGVNGYLVARGDVEGLAKGIRYCQENRKTLSHNARILSQFYGWDIAAERIAKVFDRALEPHSGPKVSIVIPNYNYHEFVTDALKSCLLQNATFDYEVIVVDDGSTDGSPELLRELASKNNFTLIEQRNQGVSHARNNGIRAAKGEYVMCLDADDTISDGYIQVCADALDNDPQLGMAYSALIFMGRDYAHDWPPRDVDHELQLEGQNRVATTAMFRKKDWQRVGGYRPYMEYSEDADLWLRLMCFAGRKAARVTAQPLFNYRMHDHSNSRGEEHRVDKFRTRKPPNWTELRPIGAPVHPKLKKPSNPVKHYDNPIIGIEIIDNGNDDDLLLTLDTLENQTIPYWTVFCKNRIMPFVESVDNEAFKKSAPLLIRIKAGEYLGEDWIERVLEVAPIDYTESGVNVLMGCSSCGKKVKNKGAVVDYGSPGEWVYARRIDGGAGYTTIPSPSRKRLPTGGKVTYRCRKDQVVAVHVDDLEMMPHRFEAIPTIAPEVETQIEEPPPPEEIHHEDKVATQEVKKVEVETVMYTSEPQVITENDLLTSGDYRATILNPDGTTEREPLSIKELAVHPDIDLPEHTIRYSIKNSDIEHKGKRGRAFLYDLDEVKALIHVGS